MLKVCMVGCGGISRAHRNAWADIPEAKLVGACDIRKEKLDPVVGEFGCNGYYDCDEMLEKEKPDILDICLPTYLHADFAVKALEKGVNVLTEKPISLKKEDVMRVYNAAKKADKRFMVAHVLRFWQEFVFVEEAYKNGTYGRLITGSMTRVGHTPKWSWDNWMKDVNRSGLVPFDLHIHDLDFIISVFGEPQNVVCDRISTEGQDAIHAVYHYPDFFIATDAAWYDSYAFHAEFRFQFEKAVVELNRGTLTVYTDGQELHPFEEAQDGSKANGINLPKTNAYFNEIRYFADCVLAGKDCDRIRPEELIKVLEIIEVLDKEKRTI